MTFDVVAVESLAIAAARVFADGFRDLATAAVEEVDLEHARLQEEERRLSEVRQHFGELLEQLAADRQQLEEEKRQFYGERCSVNEPGTVFSQETGRVEPCRTSSTAEKAAAVEHAATADLLSLFGAELAACAEEAGWKAARAPGRLTGGSGRSSKQTHASNLSSSSTSAVNLEELKIGAVVSGVVTSSSQGNIFLDFGASKNGRLKASRETRRLQEGEKVDAVIDGVDLEKGQVVLALPETEEIDKSRFSDRQMEDANHRKKKSVRRVSSTSPQPARDRGTGRRSARTLADRCDRPMVEPRAGKMAEPRLGPRSRDIPAELGGYSWGQEAVPL